MTTKQALYGTVCTAHCGLVAGIDVKASRTRFWALWAVGYGLSRTRGDRGTIFSTWREIQQTANLSTLADSGLTAQLGGKFKHPFYRRGALILRVVGGRVEDHDSPAQRPFRPANPDATDQQIADVVGVTRRRVGQIRDGNEKEVKSEPKLLNVGANQHSGDDYNHVQIV